MIRKFQIKALQESEFAPLFDLDNQQLAETGAIRMTVDKKLAFPCRVSLEDSEPGEEVILLPYQHHKTNSPYQSRGPIYVRKDATTAKPAMNEIPKLLNHRLLSLRGYDKHGQPGHRCDIPVGQPLSSAPAVVSTSVNKPVTEAPDTLFAKGLNPAHGRPGHRCDIAVGQPLASIPKKDTSKTN